MMSLTEVLYFIQGARKEVYENTLIAWEQTRMIAFYSFIPYSKKKNLKPSHLLKLPSDHDAPKEGKKKGGDNTVRNSDGLMAFFQQAESFVAQTSGNKLGKKQEKKNA